MRVFRKSLHQNAVQINENTKEMEKIERIILSRPAVEAGEKLGFLPGDMREKVDPGNWELHMSGSTAQGIIKFIDDYAFIIGSINGNLYLHELK